MYWSTDGGTNWQGYDQPPTGNNKGDPAVAIDRNGYFYVGGIASNSGQGIMRSTNGGTNWAYYTVSNPNGSTILDKNHLAVDNNSSSSYQGNLYSAWTDFGQTNYPIEFARSTDHGVTWANVQNISSNQWGQGVNLQVSANGTVYAVWANPQSASPYTETSIGFNKSTNGGVNWATPSTAISNVKGIRTSSFSTYGIRANSFPSMAASQSTGHIYVVWTNYGVPGTNTGDADIYMIKSTNGGDSWGTPTRVNNDQIGNGANQFFPWITIDPITDGISIVFFDGRSYISQKEVQVMVAYSTDGGTSFINTAVNDVDFTVAPLPGYGNNYSGDYIGITAREGLTYPLWHAQVPGVNAQGWMTKIENSIAVTVDQTFSNGSRITGSQVGHWETNAFINYTVPKTFTFNINANETMKADTNLWANYGTGNQEKYRTWNNNNDVVNHKSFLIEPNLGTLTSQFLPSNNATVQSQLLDGGNPGQIQFSDPWLIDNTDAKGKLNRGTNAVFRTVDYSVNNIGLGNQWFKGVFLNQGYDISSNPYYSVNAPATQTINGFTSYFQNWSGTNVAFQNGNAQSTGVVFNAAGATATANYKALQATSNTLALKNTSQRKIIKSPSGIMSFLYESMGRIWLERSMNDGTTWTLANNGKPIDNGPEAKSPSIDYLPTIAVEIWDPFVYFVTYQQKTSNGNYEIKLARINDAGVKISEHTIYTSNSTYASNDAAPVISTIWYESQNIGTVQQFVVVWKEPTNGNLAGGLYYRPGYFVGNTLIWNYPPFVTIEKIYRTNNSSSNPSIDIYKSEGSLRHQLAYFHLAWQQSHNEILYGILQEGDHDEFALIADANCSTGSGWYEYYRPSITTVSELSARVSFKGRLYEPPDIDYTVAVMMNPNSPGVFWNFGDGNVTSTNINKYSDWDYGTSGYILGWSENNGVSNKYITNANFSIIRNISITGKDMQFHNAWWYGLREMRAISISTTAPPYTFNLSNTLEPLSGGVSKSSSTQFSSGRMGVVTSGNPEEASAQFHFTLGDISVNGVSVDFKELTDTSKIISSDDYKSFLITKPFALNGNSKFLYGVQYGVTDSAAAVSALAENQTVHFKVELIDALTEQIIGVTDDVTYSAANVTPYENVAYEVNTKDIGNKTVKLRLSVSTSMSANYSLADKRSQSSVLAKKGAQRVQKDFRGSLVVKEYALSQNYPNPFNPTTIINYALPKAGNVVLKVYDVLGKEAATLVNDYKETGRYSVEFDASKLSSGMYIYKLTSGSFSDVKKMLLLR